MFGCGKTIYGHGWRPINSTVLKRKIPAIKHYTYTTRDGNKGLGRVGARGPKALASWGWGCEREAFWIGWLLTACSLQFTHFYDIIPSQTWTINLKHIKVGCYQKKEGLITSGPYRLVRHPQYLGMILSTLGFTSWSVWILNNTFGIGFLNATQTIGVWFIELFAYILLAYVEEHYLFRNYGESFENYKIQVPFFIPFLRTNRKDLDILVSILIPAILLFVIIQVSQLWLWIKNELESFQMVDNLCS